MTSNKIAFEGCSLFRERISCSLLSRKDIKISSIRSRDDAPGLRDFEASFLRLVEQLTDGSYIEINETGTTLRFKPGILVGSSSKKIMHDCGLSRGIGWFIEGILPMAVFSKTPVELTLLGITNDSLDLSVDVLRDVTIPLLQNFGIWGVQMKVVRRGCAPKGGGAVEISIPCIKGSLKSIQLVEEGLIKRIRGMAFCSKISPAIVMRVIGSCRQVLNNLLPDVHIGTDHFKGKEGGSSPGYSITLVAESTSGVLLSVERTAMSRSHQLPATGTAAVVASSNWSTGETAAKIPDGEPSSELPEDVGQQAAMMLMREIQLGGCIDSMHQPLILQLMVVTPEDVSKVRFGSLSGQSILLLRLLKEVYGVTFKIKRSLDDDNAVVGTDEKRRVREASSFSGAGRETVLLSCYGIGYSNVNRRVT